MDSSDYAFQSQRQVECHQAFASWEQEPFSENNDGVPKIFVVSLKGKKKHCCTILFWPGYFAALLLKWVLDLKSEYKVEHAMNLLMGGPFLKTSLVVSYFVKQNRLGRQKFFFFGIITRYH